MLLDGVLPLGSESVSLDQSSGRILAQDIVANHDQPAERRSMMDGIAVAGDAPGSFQLVGDSAAGRPFDRSIEDGQAVAIATGAVVPDGARQVVPKELVSGDDRTAKVEEWPASSFIRSIGSDFRRGDPLIEAGIVLGPSELVLAAAANRANVEVYRQPRVSILTSGDELVAPGTPLSPGQTVDSVSFGVAALCRAWGAVPDRRPVVEDGFEATVGAMRSALHDADLLVTVGGASVGKHDHMRRAAEQLGASLRFERLNLQPGKPTWHARCSDGKMILGLPGNPTSAIVCAHLLLRPLLAAMGGVTAKDGEMTAILAGPLNANGSREQFVRAVRLSRPGAALTLEPVADQDSGLQAALALATHLIRQRPNETAKPTGGTVRAIPLERSPRVDW